MDSLYQVVVDLLSRWGLGAAPWIGVAVLAAAALLLAFVAYRIARALVLRGFKSFAEKTRTRWDDVLFEHRVFQRLTHLVPAVVLHLSAPVVFVGELETFATLAQRATLAYMVFAAALALDAFFSALNRIYETSFAEARERPIKSYLQVVVIFVWVLAAILAVGALLDHSPWALLGGLGAMTAVLMLVFKDSILGLVASIQLTANDMVRLGDWIEMPQHGADGSVEEILLTTVKVRNWDMTITTVPSYKLIADAFKNWRGMTESGVRRIRRSILIDVNSVRFLDEEMLARLGKIRILRDYLDSKLEEIRAWNEEKKVDPSSFVNGRRLTNVGTFRAYLEAYIRTLPYADPEKTLMVHQQPLTDKGLALQIYFFSKEQRWTHWEALQADLFDHILAVVPEFGLRMVQTPTGADLRAVTLRAPQG